MKSGGGLIPSHQREDFKGLRKSLGTSTNQYRKMTESTTHLVELKKMIESSKMLSKINILERTKSNGNGLISLKFDILGQYIPNDPIKIARNKAVTHRVRPLITSSKGDFFGNSDKNRYSLKTPTGTMTSRHSPVADDSPKEKMFRSRSQASMAPLTTSKFHQSARLSYKKSDLNLEVDDSQKSSMMDGLRDSLVGRGKASHFKSKSQRIEMKDDLTFNSHFSTKTKYNSLFKDTPVKAMAKSPDSLHIKSKSSSKISTALPKLEKKPQKSSRLRTKRRSLDQEIAPDSDLSKQFNLQTGDPALNNVYSPDFFTPTVYPSTNYQNLLLSQRSESAHAKNNILIPLYPSNPE